VSGFNPAYLRAKQAVDSRSRNQRVWNRFLQELEGGFRPKTVLDLGAGSGAFLALILSETGLRDFDYIPLDADGGLLKALMEGQQDSILKERNIRIQPQEARLETFLQQNTDRFDLILTNAFLDLVHLKSVADPLFGLLNPGGLFYSTLLFDGVTTFLPELDPPVDQQVEALYHASMVTSGQSGYKAGRTLLALLMNSPLTILEAGSSDWAIVPRNGQYESSEEALLRSILDFHKEVLLRELSAISGGSLAPEKTLSEAVIQDWLRKRNSQFDEGRLALLTHQWDMLAIK